MTWKFKLNEIANSAAKGCTESETELLRFFIPRVQKMSESMWYELRDPTSFEQECYMRLKRAVVNYDPHRSKQSFYSFAMWRLNEVRRDHLKRRRRKLRTSLFSDLAVEDSDGKRVEFDEVDILADVESKALYNEKIALLAEGDSRKLAILTAWACGFYNDSETASLLAQRYGGKSESYRKYIIRFRSHCQKELAKSS